MTQSVVDARQFRLCRGKHHRNSYIVVPTWKPLHYHWWPVRSWKCYSVVTDSSRCTSCKFFSIVGFVLSVTSRTFISALRHRNFNSAYLYTIMNCHESTKPHAIWIPAGRACNVTRQMWNVFLVRKTTFIIAHSPWLLLTCAVEISYLLAYS